MNDAIPQQYATPSTFERATCQKCRLTTRAPQLLYRKRGSVSQKICPRCVARQSRGDALFRAVLCALAAPLFVWAFVTTPPRGGNGVIQMLQLVGAFFLGRILSVWLSVLGQSLAAMLLGLRIYLIRIGGGYLLLTLAKFSRTPVEIWSNPLGGSCVAVPPYEDARTWPLIATLCAGPALVAVAIIWLLCFAGKILARGSALTEFGWYWTLLAMLIVSFIRTIYPRNIRQKNAAWNMGTGIAQLLQSPDAIKRWTIAGCAYELDRAMRLGEYALVGLWLKRWEKAGAPPEQLVVPRLFVLMIQRHPTDARPAADAAIAQATDPATKAHLQACAALLCVYLSDDIASATAHCEEAAAVAPWDSTVQWAQALIGLANGQNDLAEERADQASMTQAGWGTEGGLAHVRAEICRRQRRVAQMHRWQAIAARIDPAALFRLPASFIALPEPAVAVE